MAGRVRRGVTVAFSIAQLACARSSDGRAAPPAEASEAGGAPSFGGSPPAAEGSAGAIAAAFAGAPAAPAGEGKGGAVAVAGAAGAAHNGDFVAGSGGGLAGGGVSSSPRESGGAFAQGGGAPSGVSVSLDLAPSLSIANQTLFFPLTGTLLPPAPAMKEPTELSGPNELALSYTRVGCAGARTETLTASPDHFGGGGVPTLLASVSITHEARPPQNAQIIVGQSTCLTRRTPEGRWLPLLSPTRVLSKGDFVSFEFEVPVEPVDAVGIFLPTYTAISNITYTIRAE